MTFLDFYLSSTDKKRSDVIAYLAALDHLKGVAPTIADGIIHELKDQSSRLKLIASENYSSLSVQLAMGNLLTDKYCEGYPYHRFYAGCENVDKIENEAMQLAKELFGVDYAYVQPHSGADANLVAFWSILTHKVQNPFLQKYEKKTLDQLSPADFETLRQSLCNQSFLGLSLHSGGHLTHGLRNNISAKMMKAHAYDVDPNTHMLDYEKIYKQAKEIKPLILLTGYSAYPRHINFAKMREIADSVGAVLMVDMAHFAGLVAGKVFEGDVSPTKYADIITSTTHKTLRGPRGGLVLCKQEFSDTVSRGCPLVLGGPLPHVIAAKAIAFREALSPDFRNYAHQIVKNAKALADSLMAENIKVITGGTDNHLVLLDVSALGLTGLIAEGVLSQAGLTANRNMIPFDKNGAWHTSGLRLGTPALTTRGMKEAEMKEIASIISLLLKNTKCQADKNSGASSKAVGVVEDKIMQVARNRVRELLSGYPLYPEIISCVEVSGG